MPLRRTGSAFGRQTAPCNRSPSSPGVMGRTLLLAPVVLAIACLAAPATAEPPSAAGPLAPAISAAAPRVVKLYGAGAGRAKGYASGVLISADGKVITALSTITEAENPRVVLSDGRRLDARVLARDPRRQIALLQIDATDLPFFELGSSQDLRPGDWVIAAANPFKIADGAEPVSFSLGVLSGRAELLARRRAQDFPYDGPVLLTDVIVATPGSAGGALVDASGRLVGVIGKQVESLRTNTWVNYALPVEEVASFVEAAASGKAGEPEPPPDAAAAPTARADLGLRLFNLGGRTRPAYVERVRPGSPAARAGLRPDDLILQVRGVPVGSIPECQALLDKIKPSETVELVVKRGEQVLTLELSPGSGE